jgi:hypothetical protein
LIVIVDHAEKRRRFCAFSKWECNFRRNRNT